MKLIIDISEEDYKRGTLGLYFNCYSAKLHDIILNGTPIPDNATNGDIVKTLFTNTLDNFCERTTFNWNSWWNAPYQKGGKE